MAGQTSAFAVSAAIIANFIVMCAKFVAFFHTNSPSMLSEGIHSTADVANQALILLGIWFSTRKPDSERPYGYYGDRYVWAMISAVGVFFLGCGVTAYHGVSSLMHPHELQNPTWAFAVLIISFVVEATVFVIALRVTIRQAAGRPLLKFITREADPAAIAVLLEDGVAILGVVLAMIAIGLTRITGNPIWDSIGTLIIASLLGLVAILLVAQNRRLLIGTSVPAAIEEKIMKVLNENPHVEAVYDFKSRMLSVDRYRIKMEVEFDGRAIAARLEHRLHEAYPSVTDFDSFRDFCMTFADEVIDSLGDEIDAIEERIRKDVPSVEHVDIEAD